MNTWIFQAKPDGPDAYDLTEKVARGIIDNWSAKLYRTEMQSGDIVLLWQSGKKAGIYAVGELVGEPYPGEDGLRINVRYNSLLKTPIYKSRLLDIPELKGLLVIRQPRGTNFRVEPSEWEALQPIIVGSSAITKPKADTDLEVEEPYDPKNEEDARKRVLSSIVSRQGQSGFRQRLLERYGARCLITGCDVVEILDAAHIQPYKGDHTNHPDNGLLLRTDLHTLFDLGLLAVDPKTMKVRLSEKLKGTSYGNLAGKSLKFPSASELRPSKEALQLHLDKAAL